MISQIAYFGGWANFTETGFLRGYYTVLRTNVSKIVFCM